MGVLDVLAGFVFGFFIGWKLMPRFMRYMQSGDRPWG